VALLTFWVPGASSHRGHPATEIMKFEKITVINWIFFYFAQQFKIRRAHKIIFSFYVKCPFCASLDSAAHGGRTNPQILPRYTIGHI
jgi:hypothetical protein